MPDAIFVEIVLMVVVPIVAGFAVLRLSRTTPAIEEHPLRSAIALFLLLVIATALLSPSGDLATPTIGGIASAVVSTMVFVALRRSTQTRLI